MKQITKYINESNYNSSNIKELKEQLKKYIKEIK